MENETLAKQHKLSDPKPRPLNDDDRDDFVAIDFETCTGLHTSAISVGMVKVIDGEIVQQFYSLINPILDERTYMEPLRHIHKISLVSAQKSPTFKDLYDGIKAFIGDLPLVCHNKSTDINIIRALENYYGLSGIRTDNAICTYQITGMSLADCCKHYGIEVTRHHNALWDAEACARIYLEIIGKPLIETEYMNYLSKIQKKQTGPLSRGKLEDMQISNKNTVFYGAKVVITGEFEDYPDRTDLADLLQSLGARVTGSISKRTTHVVVGREAGPKKLEQITELKQAGINIQTISEQHLKEIINQK